MLNYLVEAQLLIYLLASIGDGPLPYAMLHSCLLGGCDARVGWLMGKGLLGVQSLFVFLVFWVLVFCFFCLFFVCLFVMSFCLFTFLCLFLYFHDGTAEVPYNLRVYIMLMISYCQTG